MSGVVVVAPHNTLGFDCNAPVDDEGARAFYEHGFRFALRYVPRVTPKSHDLSALEIRALHDAGLAVMAVQHVESERAWVPSKTKGDAYGNVAAATCNALGIPAGVTVWLDLEAVARETTPGTVIAYCNAWYDGVAAEGYVPGVYVGWRCGLTPDQLYNALKFQRYNAAYNLNLDEYPSVRGVCMKQRVPLRSEPPAGIRFPIDIQTVVTDHLGARPTVFAPEGWLRL